MTVKKPALGRGLAELSPLFARRSASPEAAEAAGAAPPPAGDRIASLPVDLLQRGKYQPRTDMRPESLQELADSIKAQGLVQPILVRPLSGRKAGESQRYEIIAGERRWRAAQMAGLAEISVVIRDVPDEATLAMALIENIQREDLNPLEEAQGVQRLLDEFGMTHEQAAQAIGRSRSATSNLLRLLNLARPVQTMLMAGDLDMGHARALLGVDAADQINLANQVAAKRLSVRETERMVTRLGATFALAPSAKEAGKSRDLARLEEELSDALATRVTIKARARQGGQIVIDYSGLDALDGLIARLKGPAGGTPG
jgi:ParB family chromosome partitioning protein